MASAPHALAAEAGRAILQEGGNAIEAAISVAACLGVVYPHMTGLGGDGFWLVWNGGDEPVAIDGSGAAADHATCEFYFERGLSVIPARGPLAANTVAGALGGWAEALRLSRELGGRLPLSRLLEDAISLAENGFPVSAIQSEMTRGKLDELRRQPGFAATFLLDGEAPGEGATMRLPALAETLRQLGKGGIDDFYRGDLARRIAADLARIGSPVGLPDLARHEGRRRKPLSVAVRGARLYNFPPPTQGLSSLMILAIFDRLGVRRAESFGHVHGLVEATKRAFLVRDAVIGCPSAMTERPEFYLGAETLDRLAASIDRQRALPWPCPPSGGDTVWFGAIDAQGLVVSAIQSIFFEFGSGCVLPETGIVWQNRGVSFQLSGAGPRRLAPGRKPFHTLNPAMARLDDGRVLAYGAMGGEGQPQTQAAIFSRYAMFGQDLQAAITAPRWLLGRSWGEESASLKIEGRFDPELVAALRAAGHDVESLDSFSSLMGHAGAVARLPDGALEGASDPRSDGAALAC